MRLRIKKTGYNLQSFDAMMRVYLSPIKMSKDNTGSDEKREFLDASIVVSPGGPSRPQSSAAVDTTASKKGSVLSRAARKRLKDRKVPELMEVSQFYCLEFECQQVRKEHYLSTGRLVLRRHEGTACGTSWPSAVALGTRCTGPCTGTVSQVFLGKNCPRLHVFCLWF